MEGTFLRPKPKASNILKHGVFLLYGQKNLNK